MELLEMFIHMATQWPLDSAAPLHARLMGAVLWAAPLGLAWAAIDALTWRARYMRRLRRFQRTGR